MPLQPAPEADPVVTRLEASPSQPPEVKQGGERRHGGQQSHGDGNPGTGGNEQATEEVQQRTNAQWGPRDGW